jgi:hypothetical protein
MDDDEDDRPKEEDEEEDEVLAPRIDKAFFSFFWRWKRRRSPCVFPYVVAESVVPVTSCPFFRIQTKISCCRR